MSAFCPGNCYMLGQMRKFRDRVKENRPDDEHRKFRFAYVFPSGIMSFHGTPSGFIDKLDEIVDTCQSVMQCAEQPQTNEPFAWDMREKHLDFVLGDKCPLNDGQAPPTVPCAVKKDMVAFIRRCATDKDSPTGLTQCFYDEDNFEYAACYGFRVPTPEYAKEYFERIADETERCVRCPGEGRDAGPVVAQYKKPRNNDRDTPSGWRLWSLLGGAVVCLLVAMIVFLVLRRTQT